MNWYSNSIKTSQTYFDVGFSTTLESKLWIWLKDHLSVADIKEKEDTHGLFSFIGGDSLSGFYRGRFEDGENGKIVSVVKPIGVRNFLDIPESLLNSLYNEFGYDIKIVEIGSDKLV